MVKWIVLGVFGLVVLMFGGCAVGQYNGFVTAENNVGQKYAQVQNVLQRQAELIPNLVATVQGAANFERGTLEGVTQARAQLSAVSKINPLELADNPDLQRQVIEAQSSVSSSLANINAVTEAYPQLQSNQQFQSLMTELAGSVNRVSVERGRAQEAVQDFNNRVQRFPGVFLANMFGFSAKPFYQAAESSQTAPQVSFN